MFQMYNKQDSSFCTIHFKFYCFENVNATVTTSFLFSLVSCYQIKKH